MKGIVLTEDQEAVRTELIHYQQRVADWMDSLFGVDLASSPVERSMRFLEEALELVQAQGMDRDGAMRVVGYVFGRPAGEPPQEVGGVMVTLAGLCHKAGISMGAEAIREMDRIDAPAVRSKIFQKQAAKRAAGLTSDAETERLRHG